MPLETYQSHKIVDAGVITAFSLNSNGPCKVRIEGESEDRVLTRQIGDRILQMSAESGTKLEGGYLIYYADGYVSWSPPKPFEDSYLRVPPMTGAKKWDEEAEGTFGLALAGLKRGERWARTGWNGKDMWVFLVNGSRFEVNREPLNIFYDEGTQIDYRPHLDMKTADGNIVPWVATQSDLLMDDWLRVG